MRFLRRLAEEHKFKVVEPSENLKDSYISKSKKTLESSLLLEDTDPENAIALRYYSMYYMLNALLARIGVRCESHAGSILILKHIFNIDDTPITKAKKARIDSQYYFALSDPDEIDIDFNSKILDFIERMTQIDIEIYRKRLIDSTKYNPET